jgi:hypothetical protein
MKLVKSLFLGSVAGLAAVVGAQAADLPVKKAAAVEYVRVCSTYGAGFFYLPGTETCLRVGGRVRAEYRYLEPQLREDASIGFRTRGRLNIDARTATAYGLLRTFVRMEMTRDTGVYGSGSTTSDIESAFVQFGGLTAGRVDSFFDNTELAGDWFGTVRFSDAPNVNVLAYTFSFGNGFSATLALEEGRRTDGFVLGDPAASALTYAGQRIPDIVANLKYAGVWGSIQLSGAAHQIRSDNLILAPGGVLDYPDTEYGFAATLQGSVKLPMIAAGDSLWFAATYAQGALSYLGFGNSVSAGVATGRVADAYIVDGEIEMGEGWSIAGGVRHYWTPAIRQNVFGSYASVEYGAGPALLTDGGVYAGLNDFDEWRIGSNLIWSPVSGLDLGVEVIYANLDPRGRILVVPGRTEGSDDIWEGRLRVQRDF